MGMIIKNGGIKACLHDSFRSFHHQLDSASFWFATPEGLRTPSFSESLLTRMTIHRWNLASVLVIDAIAAEDLAILQKCTDSVYLNDLLHFAKNRPWGDTVAAFQTARFRLFCSHDQARMLSDKCFHATAIDPLEFLFSDQYRLRHYPSAALVPAVDVENQRKVIQAIFVLDLIQDAEILLPLIRRAAAHDSPFSLLVAVTNRVLESHVWEGLATLFTNQRISWFNPQNPLEMGARFSREKSLLITASESSAPGHVFCHQACRIAPTNVLRVTMQHGFECVGFRHHMAHDLQFSTDIRFASDIILTWQHVEDLVDLHPAEIPKCKTVGVIKSFAEQATFLRERFWRRQGVREATVMTISNDVLLAENLHSVRFSAPTRYQNFLQFIDQLSNLQNMSLTIRSHPGKRTLERLENPSRRFLRGELEAESVAGFSYFVSPPSSIVLDAVLALVPAAVWSDNPNSGDCSNYRGLPIVSTSEDWVATHLQMGYEQGLHWATQNTASFNGVDTAWATLINL